MIKEQMMYMVRCDECGAERAALREELQPVFQMARWVELVAETGSERAPLHACCMDCANNILRAISRIKRISIRFQREEPL